MLTPEEQREVAFKVVSFFIMLIIASFALLYIYHKCNQEGKSQRQKKTL
jgi:cytochrome c oxidase assembly protein Cox11